MNLLDILLVLIVGGSIVAGFMAGFARAAIGFIAVIGGILFGFWFYGYPAAWIDSFLHSTTTANILGFIAVFFGFQLAGGILGKVLSTVFKWTGLSFLDRILGAGFGFVRGSLMAVAFVAVVLAFTPSPPPRWMVDSVVLPYAVDASNVCAALAPNALKQAYRKTMSEVVQAWDDQVKRADRLRDKLPGSSDKAEPKRTDPPKPEEKKLPVKDKKSKLKRVDQ